MKKILIPLLSSLFLLLTASDCETDNNLLSDRYLTSTYYVRNSSSDTIYAIFHSNYPDTAALYDNTPSLLNNLTAIIYPNQSGSLRYEWSRDREPDKKDLNALFDQITLFSAASYRAAGGRFEDLHKYPSLGRFTFNSYITVGFFNLGTTFYYPPRTEPTVNEWIEEWKRWYQLAGYNEPHPYWPFDTPLFK